MKKLVRNEKGLTLIELLAVVVILGIIASIAIPSIGGIIDNTKKDAHIANAKQMVSSARLAMTSGSAAGDITMKELVDNGYLESVPESPGKVGDYDTSKSLVNVTQDSNGNYDYKVILISDDPHTYIKLTDPDSLTRANVDLE